jgi:hypothetical protein
VPNAVAGEGRQASSRINFAEFPRKEQGGELSDIVLEFLPAGNSITRKVQREEGDKGRES